MNVTCPNCGVIYRVDPRKVPEGGVRARCSSCPEVFEVRAPAAEAAEVSEPEPALAEAVAVAESSGDSRPGMGYATESPAEPLPPPPFGSGDPHARARRLARALVSDIVVYNPERRDRSLQQGTIRKEFREEIRKSWDEYAAQVGNQMARETSYFRDALNEILAGGAPVF